MRRAWGTHCVPGSKWLSPLRRSVVLAAAVACVCLHGQAPAPSAKDVAKRVDQHYDSLRSLKAAFAESYSGMGLTRNENGTLLLAKPGKMRWDYSSPAGKVFLLDGKYGWFYTPGDPQVQRIPAKDLDDLRSPLRFLLGHTELEKEIVNLTMAPAANGGFVLSGVPKGQENRITRLSLTVTATGTILGIEVLEVDGSLTKFTFSDERENAPMAPDAFRFKAPAGVPVVDGMPPV